MVEWSITTVLKTVVPRGTGGSNPSLSASKGVNQQVMLFTPFITSQNRKHKPSSNEGVSPKNLIDEVLIHIEIPYLFQIFP